MNKHPDQGKHPASGKMPGDARRTERQFQENPFHYERNRRQAKQARFTPAITASGGPGVHVKLGAAFLVLTTAEARRVVRRIEQAIKEAGQEDS
jgi:hypothetical protein